MKSEAHSSIDQARKSLGKLGMGCTAFAFVGLVLAVFLLRMYNNALDPQPLRGIAVLHEPLCAEGTPALYIESVENEFHAAWEGALLCPDEVLAGWPVPPMGTRIRFIGFLHTHAAFLSGEGFDRVKVVRAWVE
jgi:hypothetical protein